MEPNGNCPYCKGGGKVPAEERSRIRKAIEQQRLAGVIQERAARDGKLRAPAGHFIEPHEVPPES